MPALNEYYDSNTTIGSLHQVRIEQRGIGVIANILSPASLRLKALANNQLIIKVFETRGIKAEISNSGELCQHLVSQMGGLEYCDIFKIAGLRRWLREGGKNEPFTKSYIIETIEERIENGELSVQDKDVWNNYLDNHPTPVTTKLASIIKKMRNTIQYTKKTQCGFDRYKNLSWSINRRSGKTLSPNDIFNYLLEKKLLSLVVALQCPKCKNDSEYSSFNSDSEMMCSKCRHSFDGAPLLSGENLRFRRSSFFEFRHDKRQGAIPTLILLEAFFSSLSRFNKYLYATAINLELKDKPDPYKCETDFVLLNQKNNGEKIQIAIGECKDSGWRNNEQDGLESLKKDCNNLQKIAEALGDQFDVYIIFVKLLAFTDDELNILNTLNDQNKEPRLIILDNEDLETEFILEDKAKKLKQNTVHFTFEGMAELTRSWLRDKLNLMQPKQFN